MDDFDKHTNCSSDCISLFHDLDGAVCTVSDGGETVRVTVCLNPKPKTRPNLSEASDPGCGGRLKWAAAACDAGEAKPKVDFVLFTCAYSTLCQLRNSPCLAFIDSTTPLLNGQGILLEDLIFESLCVLG